MCGNCPGSDQIRLWHRRKLWARSSGLPQAWEWSLGCAFLVYHGWRKFWVSDWREGDGYCVHCHESRRRRKLLQSKVTLGADASVAGGPVGRSASAETDAQLHAQILSYSRSRGLFGGVALNGAVLKQDSNDNEKLYGRKVSPGDILINGKVSVPAAGRPLDRTLTKHSPHGGAAFAA